MKLVTVSEMRAIEKEADTSGLTYELMMENAGSGLAQVVSEEFHDLENPGVLGLVGSGNNGGDALVALAQLAKEGWRASAYIIRAREPDDPLLTRLRESGGEIFTSEEDKKHDKLAALVGQNAVLLDGVLGTGIRLPLKGEIATVLSRVRQLMATMEVSPKVVAVDCPSGVDTDTGEAATECIPADMTVTMAAVKKGLVTFPASRLVGELRVVGIGLEEMKSQPKAWQTIKRSVADAKMMREILPPRPPDAHKGTFGTALVVAGSVNYTGAAMLAGKAAYRVGAGLVTLAIPAPLHAALSGHFPEATWLLLPHEIGVIASGAVDVIRKNLERPTAMLIGPGFGLEEETKEFLTQLIGNSPRFRRGIGFVPASQKESATKRVVLPGLVIDADGLKLLAKIPEWHKLIPAPAVLTPHPGEMGVLTGLSVNEVQANRLDISERYAKKWGHVVVLKGANTVIAAPDGRTAVIAVASAALARAGTGDVLSGLIVGLRAQGVEAYSSAVAGGWIHAQAGLNAEEEIGTTAAVLAGDVLEAVPTVLRRLGYK